MSGRSWIVATAEQRVELCDLAGSADREEADRARAILLSLDGWTSERIALAFCVQPDSVRHWRWIFGREGVPGLRARTAPGPDPVKARAALSAVGGRAGEHDQRRGQASALIVKRYGQSGSALRLDDAAEPRHSRRRDCRDQREPGQRPCICAGIGAALAG